MSVIVRQNSKTGAMELINPFNGHTAQQWHPEGNGGDLYTETHIPAAQVATLHTSAVTVVPASVDPNRVHVFDGAVVFKPATSAGYTLGSATSLAFNYSSVGGQQVGAAALSGFVDQTTAQMRMVQPYRAASGNSEITPVSGGAIVVDTLVGNVVSAANVPDLLVRTFFKAQPISMTF